MMFELFLWGKLSRVEKVQNRCFRFISRGFENRVGDILTGFVVLVALYNFPLLIVFEFFQCAKLSRFENLQNRCLRVSWERVVRNDPSFHMKVEASVGASDGLGLDRFEDRTQKLCSKNQLFHFWSHFRV